jgi:hypothetical protein
MKLVIILVVVSAASCLVLAQGRVGSGTHRYSKYPTYNPNTRPPMAMMDAYSLAQAQIGTATNAFYCVAASCLDMTNAGFTGWTFTYANTNGQRGRVNVYFDGEVSVGAREGEVLIK